MANFARRKKGKKKTTYIEKKDCLWAIDTHYFSRIIIMVNEAGVVLV
jgi:hypothetical protein